MIHAILAFRRIQSNLQSRLWTVAVPVHLWCVLVRMIGEFTDMVSMVIGIVGSSLVMAGVFYSAGSLQMALDMPAVILVLALASFSTVGVSGKLTKAALIRHFGEAAVRAGWIGFFGGIVLICSMADPSSPDFVAYLLRAMAVATLTPLYGYGLHFLTRIAAPQA